MPQPDLDNPPTNLMDEAVEWLVKLRGGNLPEPESHTFADWLSQDARHAAAFAQAETFLSEMAAAAKLLRPVESGAKIYQQAPNLKPPVKPKRKKPQILAGNPADNGSGLAHCGWFGAAQPVQLDG